MVSAFFTAAFFTAAAGSQVTGAPAGPAIRAAAGPPVAGGGAWLLHGHAIVRTTGFPWEWLDAVHEPSSAGAADATAAAQAELAEAARQAAARLRGEPGLPHPARNRLRKSLARLTDPGDLGGLPPSAAAVIAGYQQAVRARNAADREYLLAYASAARRTHRSLLALTEDTRCAEAIWLSSPAVLDRGVPELRESDQAPSSGRARALRRQFAGYLQRLCAKNETTSFFGPIDYADFAGFADAPVYRSDDLLLRHAFVSHSAVMALAAAMTADPCVWPALSPRPHDLASIRDAVATVPGRRIALDAEAAAVLAQCDGSRPAREIARATGQGITGTLAALRRLRAAGIIFLDCDPPVTADDPLAWLRQLLDPGDPSLDRWRDGLDHLARLRERFATSSLASRRVLLAEAERVLAQATLEQAGRPARRRRQASGSSRWYADRHVLAEECVGSMTPLHLGRRAQDAIVSELTPALTLLAGEAAARHRALTAAVLATEPRLAAGAAVPLLHLLGREYTACREPGITPARAYIEQRLAAAGDSGEVRIAPADLPGIDVGADPLIASPDIMFDSRDVTAIRDGTADLILAECHDTLMLWGWAIRFHPDMPAVEAAGAELLSAACAGRQLASVVGRRRAKIMPFVFPGPAVTVGGTTDSRWATRRIPLAEVNVRFDGQRLVCLAAGAGEFLLHNGELDSVPHNALAPPRIRPVRYGTGDRSPRVYLGRVIVQRASWTVSLPPPGAGPAAGYAMFRRRCLRLGVPRYSYARPEGERKPVLVDLEAPALVDLLRHLSGPAAEVTLTEALPRPPDGLWLHGSGGRYCAELRISVVLDRRR